MARFRSIVGKWIPERERHIYSARELEAMGKDPTTTPPNEIVYEGPDRDAQRMLEKEGTEFLGIDCRLQEETMIKARQVNESTVESYLKKYKGVDLDKLEEQQRKDHKTTIRTDIEKRKPKRQVQPASGGDDFSGHGKHIRGGIGDPQDYQVPGLKTGPGKSVANAKQG